VRGIRCPGFPHPHLETVTADDARDMPACSRQTACKDGISTNQVVANRLVDKYIITWH
jgi:hypothetical protein